jgi:hypothetical protein
MTLLLLGTQGCHLCDEAKTLLDENRIVAEIVDIAIHEQWQTQFALLIPVLFHVESEQFLNWRFDSPALLSFIESLNYDKSIIKPN